MRSSTAEPTFHTRFSPLWSVLSCSSSGNAPSAPVAAGLQPFHSVLEATPAAVKLVKAGGKTQQMHRPGKNESPPAPQRLPRLDGELSRLASYCAMHRGRGGCTSPSGNSSSCCPGPAPARAVFPALRTVLWEHGTGGVTWAAPPAPGAKWLTGRPPHQAAEAEPDATSGPMIQADVPPESHNRGISEQCWSPSLRAPKGQEQSSQAATRQQHLDGTQPLPTATNSCRTSQLAVLNSSSSWHPH